MTNCKSILLIIGGGIAAYKSLELIRRLRERNCSIRTIMTEAATEFITPLSVGSLTGDKVFTDLFNREDEHDIGHIRLARNCDLILVAPATADLLAKMSSGLANDLASTVLLAADCPIFVAPAMNPKMWSNPATRKNVESLKSYGIRFIGPEKGEMAERYESGLGRMSEPDKIVESVEKEFSGEDGVLTGLKVLVTSGPTVEPIDPIRFISNRSSGKQGHAIAKAAAEAGAEVTLVSGPVAIPDPPATKVVKVDTAQEMLEATKKSLPADIAIFAAAVSDWRVDSVNSNKIKKDKSQPSPSLSLVENPDILSYIGHHKTFRPKLVVGFAAESSNLLRNARQKQKSKAADWIIANDISPKSKVLGGDFNKVCLIKANSSKNWPKLQKDQVAEKLIEEIGKTMKRNRKP